LFYLKRNNTSNTGFVISVIVLLFLLHPNQTQLNGVAYGSTSESTAVSPISPPDSPLGSIPLMLVDQIAFMISGANPSVNGDSVKEVVERLTLQTQGKGGNAEQSLIRIIEQVSQNSTGPVANSIINLALREGNAQPQQQPIAPQPQQQPATPQQQPIAPQAQQQPIVPQPQQQPATPQQQPIAPQAQQQPATPQQQQTPSSPQPAQKVILPQQNPEPPGQNVTGQGTNPNGLNDLRSQGLPVDEPGVCYTQGDLGTEPIDCEDLRGEKGGSGDSGESEDDESESE
jgi:outer membrane biosynthesis protein TonB